VEPSAERGACLAFPFPFPLVKGAGGERKRIGAEAQNATTADFRAFLGVLGWLRTCKNKGLADGVGFEPTVRLHARRFSRPLP
jgi:hypothetical protein